MTAPAAVPPGDAAGRIQPPLAGRAARPGVHRAPAARADFIVAQRPDVPPAHPPPRDGRDRRAWAVARPEALGDAARGARCLDGRLPGSSVDRGEWARPPDDRFDYWILTGAAADRRRVPRLRDVRDRRDAEPDPLPRLPPSRRRLAAGVVPDRAEDRAVALAAAVRRALRPGRPARPAGRRHARASAIEFDRMPVLNVTSFWLFALATSASRRSTSASCASAGPTSQSLVERRRRARRRRRPDPAGADRPRRPRRALRLRARHRARRQSDGRVDRPRDARRGRRPDDRRAIPTGSSPAPGSAASSCRSSRLDPARDPMPRDAPARRPQRPRRADDRRRPAGRRDRRRAPRGGRSRASSGGSRSMLGQFASIAALNLRNAVLLRHVQDLAERDSLTGAANRRMFQLSLERVLATATSERGVRGRSPRSCSSTSTTSRSSTTRSATPPATPCSSRSPSGSRASSARATSWPGSAATSSRS